MPGRTGAGVGLLLAVTGTAVGAAAGGLWGALAGLLYAGAVRNTYRAARTWADPDDAVRSEAVRSATVAVFGGFMGIVATVQAASRKSEDAP